jgi:dTDP-4-amino-4,6-dideoxygalactose transaminase
MPPLTCRVQEDSIVKRDEFLPFSPPLIGDEEIREVVDTLRSGWITTGKKTQRFEAQFASYVGARGALALSSGTASLHCAVAAAGIGPGDEVIVPTMTFCATANVVEFVGARPILVDVEPDTLNIDPQCIEKAVTSRTRAVIPVHYAGHPADMEAIRDIADRFGLLIIEDAAHALSASFKGRVIGSGDNPTCFSFHPTKNLTTIEGGMLTADPDFIDRARIFSFHGMSREALTRYDKAGSWRYDVLEPGFKYNMTDVQASVGLWQLSRLGVLQDRRREIVTVYRSAFGASDALELPAERSNVKHAWHIFPIRIRNDVLSIDRDHFVEELKNRNIGTSVHYTPIHMFRYYQDKYGCAPSDLPVAAANYRRILSLSTSPRMTPADTADVIDAVLDVVERYRR